MKIPPNKTVAIIWSVFIIVSATFMRQVFEILRGIGGRDLISIMISIIFILSIILLFIKFRKEIPPKSKLYIFLLILIAATFAQLLPLAEERTHILTYGLLGFLWGQEGRTKFQIILYGVVAGISVSILDEGLQALLPYRVGELRDICINIICSLWGSTLVTLLNSSQDSR